MLLSLSQHVKFSFNFRQYKAQRTFSALLSPLPQSSAMTCSFWAHLSFFSNQKICDSEAPHCVSLSSVMNIICLHYCLWDLLVISFFMFKKYRNIKLTRLILKSLQSHNFCFISCYRCNLLCPYLQFYSSQFLQNHFIYLVKFFDRFLYF